MQQPDTQTAMPSWEEKREQRFDRWRSPPGASFDSPEAGQAYRQRVERFIQAIKLERPDRVPVILPLGNYPVYYAGSSLHKVMYDYQELERVWLKFMNEFELDTFSAPMMVTPGRVLELLDVKLQKFPGHGLARDVTMTQFVEDEYMLADEYDAFLSDPLDWTIRRHLPRGWGVFKPLADIQGNLATYDLAYRMLILAQQPEYQEMFRVLGAAAEEYAAWRRVVLELAGTIMAYGLPSFRGVHVQAPFDFFGDTNRGTRGIVRDMYRQPDKLLYAMDAIYHRTIQRVIDSARMFHCPLVFMPLHKGDDTFMSEEQFRTFYWPPLRRLLLGMIEEGFVPYLFAEGKYNNRLELIADLPRGSVLWHFDQTDMTRASEVLGGSACIAGNVPSSMLYTATPAQVQAHCRELIETCGRDGGYILTGGASIDKCNPDNLRAMTAAAQE